MSYRRRNLDSVVSSGRSTAIGTRIRFLNNDIADMAQDGNFNIRKSFAYIDNKRNYIVTIKESDNVN